MEVKNKTLNILLFNVLLPIVVTVISTIVIDKIKNKNGGTQVKTASQPTQKASTPSGGEETTETTA